MILPLEFFTHFFSKNQVKWNIDLTWLKKFHTHSNINTWDPLMIELLYLSLPRPPPLFSSRTLTVENEILNSIYFYSKNVFTTKRWSRWKMCCICKYALLFILPQLVWLALQISCRKFLLFQKLARKHLENIPLFRISRKASGLFSKLNVFP